MRKGWVMSAVLAGWVGTLAADQAAVLSRAADAMERVTWRTRTLVADDRLTDWDLGISDAGLTFLETVVRADAALVPFVEASSTQRVSPEIEKSLDYDLTREEIAALRARMGNTVRVSAYRVDKLSIDGAIRRRVFEFADALGATTLVVPAGTDLANLDALAEEFTLNVAVADSSSETLNAMQGRSRRLGVAIDTGLWIQDGVPPREGLARVKDRLLYVNVRDRSARSPNARNVIIGKGTGNLGALFDELQKQRVHGIAVTIDTTGIITAPADIFAAVAAFEAAVQPAYAARFLEFARTKPIRFDLVPPAVRQTLTEEELATRTADLRQKIDRAIPNTPPAAPKKPRKLLVIESLEGMSHDTIPIANVMIQRMGEKTGAWTTVFSNDLINLQYPRVKEFDAVFLNSIVGEFLPDPALRDDLLRYVSEGGGIGGIHGTPWASRNWDEFADLIGAQNAPHRIENGILKVYDKESPVVRSFKERDLPFREEYYRFDHKGNARLRWDELRVLLTVDLDEKVPVSTDTPWEGYRRPDRVYPVAWIREYGKGRVFYNSLGHMPETFTKPEIVGHLLAGIQYILGDLEANPSPNPIK